MQVLVFRTWRSTRAPEIISRAPLLYYTRYLTMYRRCNHHSNWSGEGQEGLCRSSPLSPNDRSVKTESVTRSQSRRTMIVEVQERMTRSTSLQKCEIRMEKGKDGQMALSSWHLSFPVSLQPGNLFFASSIWSRYGLQIEVLFMKLFVCLVVSC